MNRPRSGTCRRTDTPNLPPRSAWKRSASDDVGLCRICDARSSSWRALCDERRDREALRIETSSGPGEWTGRSPTGAGSVTCAVRLAHPARSTAGSVRQPRRPGHSPGLDGAIVRCVRARFARCRSPSYPSTIWNALDPYGPPHAHAAAPDWRILSAVSEGASEYAFGGDKRANGARRAGHPSQSLNGGTALPFGYDGDDLLTCAGATACPAAGALTITPDPQNGRLSATTLGNVADAYAYDTNGLLASYAAALNGNPVYVETIVSRDADGRIHEKTDALSGTTHDWIYSYDPAGRLTDVTEDGNFESHYAYDGDDNRTTFTNASGTVNPTYDVQDRLSTYGPASYAYTANGELTSKTLAGQTTNYTYDALGNLLHVGFSSALPDGTTAVDYIVDGQNRRVGRMVNGTLVQGWLYQDQLRPVAQLDGTGTNVVARFVYGSKSNVPDYMVTFSGGTAAGTYRILSDHVGSPRLVVDASSGNVIETISYDEFGNETDTLATTLPTGYQRIPFGFAGGLYDPETTLVRFGARDYDASVGRWTSKDPVRFRGGTNLYVYAGNDPIDNSDVLGTDPLDYTPVPDNPFLPNPKCVQDCMLAAYNTAKGFLASLGLANRFVCGSGRVFGGPPFGLGGLVGMAVAGVVTVNLCSMQCADLNAPSSAPPLPCDPTVQSCL